MKQKVISVESIRWRLRKPSSNRWEAFGRYIHGLKTEDTSLFLEQKKCQFPGCTCKLKFFTTNPSGTLKPWGQTKEGEIRELTIDHKIARCLGGKDEHKNKWVMCNEHNNQKSFAEAYLKNILDGKKVGKMVVW